jgi:hypothetical protein
VFPVFPPEPEPIVIPEEGENLEIEPIEDDDD